MSRAVSPKRVAVVLGVVLSAGLVASLLVPGGVDPSDFLAHGTRPPSRVVLVPDSRGTDRLTAAPLAGGPSRPLGRFPSRMECCTGLVSVDVEPGGRRVWVSTPDQRLFSVDVASGDREDQGQGLYPTVSPDRRWLAYRQARDTEQRGGGLAPRVVVRDLRSDREESVAFAPAGALSWSPDSTRLLVQGAARAAVVSVSPAGVPQRPRELCPDVAAPAAGPVWAPDGAALAVRVDPIPKSFGAAARTSLLRLDLRTCTERVLTTLVPPDRVGTTGLDLDTSGRHVLIATAARRVYRWRSGLAHPVAVRTLAGSGQLASW